MVWQKRYKKTRNHADIAIITMIQIIATWERQETDTLQVQAKAIYGILQYC